jgi:hypothetical protein
MGLRRLVAASCKRVRVFISASTKSFTLHLSNLNDKLPCWFIIMSAAVEYVRFIVKHRPQAWARPDREYAVMTVKRFLQHSGASALALALFSTLAPAAAVAQEEPAQFEQQDSEPAPDRRVQTARGQDPEARREVFRRAVEARQERQQADDSGVDGQRAQIEQRIRERLRERRADAPRPTEDSGDAGRNRTYSDPSRDRSYGRQQANDQRDRGDRGVDRQRSEIDRRLRDRGIDRRTGDVDWRVAREAAERDREREARERDAHLRDGRYRDGHWRDGRYGHGYGDGQWGRHRGWDRHGWRSDRRYDWYRYRSANRHLFRPDRYYPPHRGYSYSRARIGIRLGSSFYGSRYWINDPWRYRLPEVYGPYRWVRYYDDVLLVDIYSGEVVDVIHDFFW